MTIASLLTSCSESVTLRNYTNEVSYNVFAEEIIKRENASFFKDNKEKDLYYQWHQSKINIENKEKVEDEIINIEYDADKKIAYNSIINDNKNNGVLVEGDELYLFALFDITNIGFSVSPDEKFKYYIDNNVYTAVYPFHPLSFGVIEYYTYIEQMVFNENSAYFINHYEHEGYRVTSTISLKQKNIEL